MGQLPLKLEALPVKEILVTQQCTVPIADKIIFQHGDDGLRLWDAGVVLARFVAYNAAMFAGKTVLELGAGVGLAGIVAAKLTSCHKVVMTDINQTVLANMSANVMSSNTGTKVSCVALSWASPDTIQDQFDILMGSDVVYYGCQVQALYQVLLRRLKPNGFCVLIIPDRKNYAQLFLALVKPEDFTIEKRLLDGQYTEPPIASKDESQSLFGLLGNVSFYAYILKRVIK